MRQVLGHSSQAGGDFGERFVLKTIAVPQKVTHSINIDLVILLPGIYQKLQAGTQIDICAPVSHSSIIHNGQKVKTTQMSISG